MAELFEDVLGDAISIAVRRACDDVGRAPYGELGDANGQPETVAPGAEPTVDLRLDDLDLDLDRLPPASDVDDPYEVLGLPHGASWERINAAHRRLARAWHPDGAADDEHAQREELIRRLNVAYAELRVRRGR